MRKALCVVYFVFVSQSWAGEIVLKNGDRLTGRIVRMDQSSLEFQTDLLGKVSVPWNVVVKVESDTPVYVSIRDRAAVKGQLSMIDGRVQVRSNNAATD